MQGGQQGQVSCCHWKHQLKKNKHLFASRRWRKKSCYLVGEANTLSQLMVLCVWRKKHNEHVRLCALSNHWCTVWKLHEWENGFSKKKKKGSKPQQCPRKQYWTVHGTNFEVTLTWVQQAQGEMEEQWQENEHLFHSFYTPQMRQISHFGIRIFKQKFDTQSYRVNHLWWGKSVYITIPMFMYKWNLYLSG